MAKKTYFTRECNSREGERNAKKRRATNIVKKEHTHICRLIMIAIRKILARSFYRLHSIFFGRICRNRHDVALTNVWIPHEVKNEKKKNAHILRQNEFLSQLHTRMHKNNGQMWKIDTDKIVQPERERTRMWKKTHTNQLMQNRKAH